MNKVKYKLNREWLNELLKHKNDSNVYFSLSDNDIRILLTYIDVLQSKIDKANEIIKDWHQEYNGLMETNNIYIPKDKPSLFDLRDILKEDK